MIVSEDLETEELDPYMPAFDNDFFSEGGDY
jgi:hypothetical protein